MFIFFLYNTQVIKFNYVILTLNVPIYFMIKAISMLPWKFDFSLALGQFILRNSTAAAL